MKRFISLVLVLSMLFSVLCTTVVAVSDVSSVIGGGTTNTDAPVNNKYAYDKTATPLYKNDYTDVTLTVGGDQEDLSSDVVFIVGHGPASNYDYIVDMIHRMLVAVDGSPAKIKLGMVGFADTTEDETVLPLQEMKDTVPGNKVSDYRLDNRYSSGNQYTESEEDWNARKSAYEAKVAEWEKDSALVQDMEYVIARALEGCEAVYRGVNLESALITARDMLAADDTVPAGRKHMIVISTGLAYWFDDDNGNATTIIGTNKFGTFMYGNKYWLRARNNSTNTENGYNIPTWAEVKVNGVVDYQESWKQYWAQNVAWIAADQNKFSYTPGKLFGEFSSANGVEIRPNNNSNYRYGYAIQNADDLLKVVGAVPYFDGAADPAEDANAAHALNYERGQYEAWVVYKQMETPIGEKVETVLKDANGNNITVDGLGFNCYAIANGKTSNPGEEDVWLSSKAIGYNFMHMMGGKNTVNYRDGDVTFFKPIENEIMYALSEGSTVVDYIGYSKEDGYNFDFVDVVDGVVKLPVLKYDDVTYYTTKLDAPLDNATATYVFSRTKNGDPTFTMNYYYGNDGTTDEYFKWIFDETIGGFSKVTLTYSLKLVERNMEIGTHTPDTNIEATLYPIDSKGNDGDPEKFPIPSVEYIVVPDDEYDGPNDYDKSKTATPLYNNRYTDVTLSLPGEAETLASDIVFVVDKSSSDLWSGEEATALFDQLIDLQEKTGALINISLVIFDYSVHAYQNSDGEYLCPLDDELNGKLGEYLKSYSKWYKVDEDGNYVLDSKGNKITEKGENYTGGTNADAGLTVAKEILDAHEGVDASRKHVVFISDGLTWLFYEDADDETIGVGTPYNILLKNNETTLYGDIGIGSWCEAHHVSGYRVPGGSWEAYWEKLPGWVAKNRENDIYKTDYSLYTNSVKPVSQALGKDQAGTYAFNLDRGIYEAWESYVALEESGYNCYAINTQVNKDYVGYFFMNMLNGGTEFNVEDLSNKVFYLISKGSKVVDYIGYSDDPEEGYNFDFIDKIGNELKLPVLKVGENTYFTTKLKTPVNGATASYTFSLTEGGEPTFTMDYYRGKGTTDEYFIWTINENVSRFAPVSLTYTLDLVERSEIPGLHVDVDTNRKAILYPKDSDGNDGTPEPFEKPKVEYTVDPVEVTVTKIWDDDGDRDRKRPESITIRLYDDMGVEVASKVVTANDDWTCTFEGLREYRDGKKIEYRITEDAVPLYTTVINGFEITNSYTPENTQVSVKKNWNDANDQDGLRPESITINLLANGKVIKTVTVSEADGWTWSFTDLPKFEDGIKIEYTVTEEAVEGYRTSVEGSAENGFIVTNTHLPEKTEVSVKKNWNDANNQDGLRPESITINLLANGKVIKTVAVSEADGWTWSFTDLPKFESGIKIEYTVTEEAVEGYRTSVEGSAENGFIVTNTHLPEKT
ncbi:MAG: Cna B-type domain-containing protein, partial [Clostridia bacterium]|nr:Cna B-type domain-containing protein [Clostridia bacterium]